MSHAFLTNLLLWKTMLFFPPPLKLDLYLYIAFSSIKRKIDNFNYFQCLNLFYFAEMSAGKKLQTCKYTHTHKCTHAH